jgi:formylglycine-generating enzyme required for sulfatase activity
MQGRRPVSWAWACLCVLGLNGFVAAAGGALAPGGAVEEPRNEMSPAAAPEPTVADSAAAVPSADPLEDMLLVPAGEFLMGSRDADSQAESNEKPQRTLSLPAFYIDQFEVTNIQYKRFVDDTGYPAPPSWKDGNYADEADFYPVVEVTWWDATAYARWAGKRLPTEAEWEKAARGTDGRRYPWGNHYNSHLANTGRYFVPANANIEAASPCGAVNMAGNAAEWTASVFEPYQELVAVLPAEFGGVDSSAQIARPKSEKSKPGAGSPAPGGATQNAPSAALTEAGAELARDDSLQVANDPRRQFLSAEELRDKRPRVYRGGAINSYPRFLRCANRASESPDARWYNLGFRCAMDAPPRTPAPPGER